MISRKDLIDDALWLDHWFYMDLSVEERIKRAMERSFDILYDMGYEDGLEQANGALYDEGYEDGLRDAKEEEG